MQNDSNFTYIWMIVSESKIAVPTFIHSTLILLILTVEFFFKTFPISMNLNDSIMLQEIWIQFKV